MTLFKHPITDIRGDSQKEGAEMNGFAGSTGGQEAGNGSDKGTSKLRHRRAKSIQTSASVTGPYIKDGHIEETPPK